jgi:hypothetical protein
MRGVRAPESSRPPTRGLQPAALRRSNKRMHATRDTTDFIFGQVVGGRVMRGVRRLLAKHEAESFGPISRARSVASSGRGVVRFTVLMRRGRMMEVARSACSRCGIAPEQAHARDRRHDGSHAPAKVRGGA